MSARRAPRATVLAAGVLASTLAAKDAASLEPTSVGALPAGEVGTLPRAGAAPSVVGANERVPGFFLANAPAGVRGKRAAKGQGWAFLVANADDAADLAKSGVAHPPREMDVCFTTADRAAMFTQAFMTPEEARDPEPAEWPSWFEARPTMRFQIPGGGARRAGMSATGAVVAVHAERFVRADAGHASLEMTDAWVDAETHGARLIGTSSLPLRRVATAPTGIDVYAARSRDGVEVVVTGSRVADGLAPEVRLFARQLSRLNASFGEGRTGISDCGHIRVALHPSAEVGPSLSVVHAIALLPSLDAPEPAPGAANAKETVVSVTGFMPTAVPSFKAIQSLRKRPVDISVSVTQTASDAEPVVSVAVAWAGREARQ